MWRAGQALRRVLAANIGAAERPRLPGQQPYRTPRLNSGSWRQILRRSGSTHSLERAKPTRYKSEPATRDLAARTAPSVLALQPQHADQITMGALAAGKRRLPPRHIRHSKLRRPDTPSASRHGSGGLTFQTLGLVRPATLGPAPEQ